MKHFMKFFCVLSFALTSTLFASEASVHFDNARLFAPVQGSTMTAGYLTLMNHGDQKVDIKLLSVKGFKTVELHETYEKDGRMGMRKIDKVSLEPNEVLVLAPGKHHLMLFDADSTIKPDKSTTATFLVNDKKIDVPFKIISR